VELPKFWGTFYLWRWLKIGGKAILGGTFGPWGNACFSFEIGATGRGLPQSGSGERGEKNGCKTRGGRRTLYMVGRETDVLEKPQVVYEGVHIYHEMIG